MGSNMMPNMSGNSTSGNAMSNTWGRNASPRTEATAQPTTPLTFGSNDLDTSNDRVGSVSNLNVSSNFPPTNSMLENSDLRQMINKIISDPTLIQAMLNNTPIIEQSGRNSPDASLSNPLMMRSMLNSDNFRSILHINSVNRSTNPIGDNPVSSSAECFGDHVDFSELLDQFHSTTVSSNLVPLQQQVVPDERINSQLQILNEMGFSDKGENKRVLTQTHGNMNRVIDMLLSNTQNLSREAPNNFPNDELAD